jgi:DNA polymerase-3 subunit alpha
MRTLNTKKGQPMAFVTLEDLDGKVDLVLFPKIWAAHRDVVQTNQIIVARGTVQASGEAVSILVNSVQTKLTIAHDSSSSLSLRERLGEGAPLAPWERSGEGAFVPPPPDDYDFWPAAEAAGEQGGRGAGETTRSSGLKAEQGFNGSTAKASVAEPAPGYVPDAATIPPPPDDDEGEDDYLEYEAAEEDTPTRPDPAAVDEAKEPPPPPVVTMPTPVTSDELRVTSEEQVATSGEKSTGSPAAINGMAPDAYEPMTNDALPVMNDQPLPVDDYEHPTNGLSKLLVVEIRASGDWKDACRRTLKVAGQYEGNAMLRLQLAGQDMVMDFPNHRVGSAVELIEALERLPGVGRVYER